MSTQLDMLRRQAEAGARNRVAGAGARVRREASLVNQASRLCGDLARQEDAFRRRERRRSLAPEALQDDRGALPPEPGRRSPVQPVKVPAGYYRRRALRTAGWIALALVLAECGWLLLRSGLLPF